MSVARVDGVIERLGRFPLSWIQLAMRVAISLDHLIWRRSHTAVQPAA
jgi:hypothetical protein